MGAPDCQHYFAGNFSAKTVASLIEQISAGRLTRIAPIALLSAALLSLTTLAPSQRGAGYGPFSRYPFDQWAAENQKPQIRWYIRVDPARLSPTSASLRNCMRQSTPRSCGNTRVTGRS